ncbi:MAG: hypothetical protein RL499_114 [Actinomycetota bacterium]
MDIQFDPEADAAYITLRGKDSTYSHMVALDPESAGGMINFDFDTDGFLMGVEILGAHSCCIQMCCEPADALELRQTTSNPRRP